MTTNTNSAQERTARIDLAQLDKDAGRIARILDCDGATADAETIRTLLTLAHRSLTSGAPADLKYLTRYGVGGDGELQEMVCGDAYLVKDVEELFDAVVHDAAAPSAEQAILDDLDVKPDQHHQVADMANIGYELMQTIKAYRPEFCWSESPAEIVGELIDEMDEESSGAAEQALREVCRMFGWSAEGDLCALNDRLVSEIHALKSAGAAAKTEQAPSDSELLQALRNAERLLRAAGFAMTGTCSSKIIEAINKHADTTAAAGAAAPSAEQAQWRNIQKAIRQVAEFCFGGPQQEGNVSMAAAYISVINCLTAKDGVDLKLEPLPAGATAKTEQDDDGNSELESIADEFAEEMGCEVTDGERDAVKWGYSRAAGAGSAQPHDVCAEMRALCLSCGGTGDVHSIDGEWRGECNCPAGISLTLDRLKIAAAKTQRENEELRAALARAPSRDAGQKEASTQTVRERQLEAVARGGIDDLMRIHQALGFSDDEIIDADKMIERIAYIDGRTAAIDDSKYDAKRLMFAMEDIDGFKTVEWDKYEYASHFANENGRDEPNRWDELMGVRMMIDAAMVAATQSIYTKEKP